MLHFLFIQKIYQKISPMKKFTLYLVFVFLAMNVAGQSKPVLNKFEAQHHEVLVKLAGERRATTIERVLSNPFPLQHETLEKNANAYTLKLDSTVTSILDQEPDTWRNDMMDEFIYDASWKPVELIENIWSLPLGGWELYGTTKLSYNNQGQLSKLLMYSADNNILVDSALMESHYDTSGRLDSILTYEVLNGETWELSIKQLYTYNESGLLAEMTMVEYDEFEEMWMEFMVHRYTYNAAGQRLNFSVYFADEEEDFLYSETLYFYDTLGRLTHKETTGLNIFTFEMEKSYKVAYVYGAGGDISEETYYQWGGDWFESNRIEFFYNGFINYSDVAFPYAAYSQMYGAEEADFTFNKLPIETRNYDLASPITSKTLFYYSSTSSTGTDTPVQESAGLFPNPATSQISFNWPESNEQRVLEVYQINGAKVLQQVVSAGSSVPVGHLNRGLYFYRLSDNGQVHSSGKMLLQ